LAWAWHCARACLPVGLALGEPVAGDAAAGAPAAGAPAAGGGAAPGVVEFCAFAGANARPATKAAMKRRFMGGIFLDLVSLPAPAGAGSEQCVGADERRLNRSIIQGARFLPNASRPCGGTSLNPPNGLEASARVARERRQAIENIDECDTDASI